MEQQMTLALALWLGQRACLTVMFLSGVFFLIYIVASLRAEAQGNKTLEATFDARGVKSLIIFCYSFLLWGSLTIWG